MRLLTTHSTFPTPLLAWFAIASIILGVSATASAQNQRKERREGSQGPPVALNADQVAELEDCWINANRPTFLLFCGIWKNGNVTYDQSKEARLVLSATKNELMRGAGSGIVVPEVEAIRQQQMNKVLERATGQRLSAEDVQELGRTFEADIMIDIHLIPDGPRFTPNLRAFSTVTGREIAEFPLAAIGFDDGRGGAKAARIIATAVVKNFIGAFCRYANKPQPVIVQLYSFAEDDDVSRRFIERDLPKAVAAIEGVSGTPKEITEKVGDVHSAQFEIYFNGNPRDVKWGISDFVEEYNRAPLIVSFDESEGRTFIGFVFSANTPDWWTVTDVKSDAFPASVKARQAMLRRINGPRLGIVVGQHLKDRLAPYENPAFEGGGGIHEEEFEALAGLLSNQFSDLGFTVRNADAMRDRIGGMVQRNERFDDIDHLATALGESRHFEILLHVNAHPDGHGGYRLNAEFVNLSNATTMGFQRWPDADAAWHPDFRVKQGDMKDIARFMAGSLVTRFDRVAEGDGTRTLDVLVKNLNSPQQLMKLIEMVEGIPWVKSIGRRTVNFPVASFEVTYINTKTHDDVFEKILDEQVANRLGFPWSFDAPSRNQVVFDLDRKVLIENPNPAPKVDPTNEAEYRKVAQPPAISGQDPLVDAMRAARDSVLLLGVEINGTFITTGTGWVVRPDMVATNAHVNDGLMEYVQLARDEGIPESAIKVIGKFGPEKQGRVILSKSDYWNHPRYAEWSHLVARYKKQTEGMTAGDFSLIPGYDVGLIRITGGDTPGAPLRLATRSGGHAGLQPLDRLGYVGFPAEGVAGREPALMYVSGTLLAQTDYFFESISPAEAHLLHYDLVVLGGSSGSPVLGPNGHVIGVNSAASFTHSLLQGYVDKDGIVQVGGTRRVGNGIGYGQRIDVLQELLDTVR